MASGNVAGDGFDAGDAWTDGWRKLVVLQADDWRVTYVDVYEDGARARRVASRIAWVCDAAAGEIVRLDEEGER